MSSRAYDVGHPSVEKCRWPKISVSVKLSPPIKTKPQLR